MHLRSTVVVTVAVVSLVAAPAALACINGMSAEDHKADNVARSLLRDALKHLDAGRAQDALDATAAARKKFDTTRGLARLRAERWADRIEGIAHLKLGHPNEALPPLRRALGGFFEDPYVGSKLGQALVETGDTKHGFEVLHPLAESDLIPDAEGWVAAARAYQANGDAAKATSAARTALLRDPSNAAAKSVLAELTKPPPANAAPSPKSSSGS